MAKKFKMWDVVVVIDDKVDGVIMDIFDGGDYRTDARGVQGGYNLKLAPVSRWERSYEILANIFNCYPKNYEKDYLKSFFDKVTKLYPNNDNVKCNPNPIL